MTWRRLRRDQRGSVLGILVVVPVLVGAVAAGVETGQLYRTKRQMQGAVDAAALAGSVDRLAGKSVDTITATARYEAQRNGFQHGVNGVAVTVNAPPLTGPNVGTTGAVEVTVTKSQGFSLGAVLSSALGVTSSNFTMRTRSVAAQGTYTATSSVTTSTSSADGCLVALTTDAEQGVRFTSFNTFTSDCVIYSNGTSTGTDLTTASVYMSSFNNATMKGIWSRGRAILASYNHAYNTSGGTLQPQQNQSIAIVDPYANLLPIPSPLTCTHNPFSAPGGSSIELTEGVYCGGLTISSYNDVYFKPGTYYIANGDLYLTSVNNVTCPTCTTSAGVTFVLTQTTGNNADIGGVRISSDNNVTLNAPTGGPYPGILFYQDRRVTAGTMTSTSKIFTLSSLNNARLTGVIYFPNNRIDISSLNNSGSTTNGCTVWIGRYVKFSSYNNNYIAGCGSLGIVPPGIITTTTQNVTTTVNKGKLYE